MGFFLLGLLIGILIGWFGTFYLRRRLDHEIGYDHIKDKW